MAALFFLNIFSKPLPIKTPVGLKNSSIPEPLSLVRIKKEQAEVHTYNRLRFFCQGYLN